MTPTDKFLNYFRALLGYQKCEEPADDGVTYYYTNLRGERNGRYTEYHNNGTLMAVAKFCQNEPESFVEFDPETGRLLRMVEFDTKDRSKDNPKIVVEFDQKGRATITFNTEDFPELAAEQKIWARRSPTTRTAMLTAQARTLVFENTIADSQARKRRKAREKGSL